MSPFILIVVVIDSGGGKRSVFGEPNLEVVCVSVSVRVLSFLHVAVVCNEIELLFLVIVFREYQNRNRETNLIYLLNNESKPLKSLLLSDCDFSTRRHFFMVGWLDCLPFVFEDKGSSFFLDFYFSFLGSHC